VATLQPGEKARMYALGGIARGGATRGGYVDGRAYIAIDGVHVGYGGTPGSGHVGTIIESLTIADELNDTPNTCAFRTNALIPPAGAEVRVTLGTKNRVMPLFAGFALHVEQGYAGDVPAHVQAAVSCVDYVWLLAFVKVTTVYRAQSASAIVIDLIAKYGAVHGFTSGAVVPNLPTIDQITYTNEELDQAISRLATRIGAYWYVDYLKVVHFFINAEPQSNGAPEVLTPQHKTLAHVRKTADRTQVLTRVYVEGQGTNVLGAVAPGDSKIPLEAIDMFAIAPDVFAKLSPHGSDAGAQHVTFTGIVPGLAGSLVGPGVGPPGAPIVAPVAGAGLGTGRYGYAYTDVTPAGETLPSPIASVDVGGAIPAPTIAPTATPAWAASGLGLGIYNYGYTYTTGAGGETLGAPPVSCQTLAPLAPTGGIGTVETLIGGFLPIGWYGYRVTYVGDAGGETIAAAFGASAYLAGNNNTAGIGIGTTAESAPPAGVAAVRVYRSAGGGNDSSVVNGPFFFVGNATKSGAAWLFTDTGASLGAAIPTTNTAQIGLRVVRVVTAASPDPRITGVKIYRTRVNDGSGYFLVTAQGLRPDGTVIYDDTLPDAGLGAVAPTADTSGNGYRSVLLTNIAPGAGATTARRLYRTAVNGAPLKLLAALGDNVTTTYTDTIADAGLGATAPVNDTSGLPQVAGQVPAGAAAIPVANPFPFETDGGWAVIGNGEQVIRYTGKTATTLIGIPGTGIGAIVAGVAYNSTITAAPMLTGIPTSGAFAILEALGPGDEINLVVRREDAARQTTLAAMIKVGPGWREEWVQDRRLAIPEARARGDATLAIRPLEDVTISYTSRDMRTASGKTITANLPAPTNIAGSFRAQTVTISNFRPIANQYPTYTVTASSNQFSFEDWLRQMETKV
jgi:hypothetical protein